MGTTAAETKKFDRAAHCRRIGQTGGMVTVERHGRGWMRAIGKAGAKVTIERHGVAYFNGLVSAKGWNGRRTPDIGVDLAAARILAECA